MDVAFVGQDYLIGFAIKATKAGSPYTTPSMFQEEIDKFQRVFVSDPAAKRAKKITAKAKESSQDYLVDKSILIAPKVGQMISGEAEVEQVYKKRVLVMFATPGGKNWKDACKTTVWTSSNPPPLYKRKEIAIPEGMEVVVASDTDIGTFFGADLSKQMTDYISVGSIPMEFQEKFEALLGIKP